MFTDQQWRVFNRIRRKYKVSIEFLKYNTPNIIKFIAYYARRLHFVLKRSAERSRQNRTVVIKYNRLMRSLFDEAYRKRIQRRMRNIKQWSRRMVQYLRKTEGVKEYIIIKKLKTSQKSLIQYEEVTKQLKEQLELLKSGKRSTQLMESSLTECELKSGKSLLEVTDAVVENPIDELKDKITEATYSSDNFILNEKTGILEINDAFKNIIESNVSTIEVLQVPNDNYEEQKQEHAKSNANILDLLMSKVRATTVPPVITSSSSLGNTCENDAGNDSGEEFLGFAEDENIPGLMRTPLVPSIVRSKEENAAFVSESLDEYFRQNSLDTSAEVGNLMLLQSDRKLRQANIDGLMTVNCKPPKFEMPAVPESLQKLRTVAERRNFLQKFSKNLKLAIINNEAAIYRELQRKIRQPKTKITSQQAMQAISSQMAFTRQGWQAASFVTTEMNKFFYQKLYLQDEKSSVELYGVRGNNVEQYKAPYSSKLTTLQSAYKCSSNCVDCHITKCLKPIFKKTYKKKLCKEPYRAIFKPCPLSQKPNQSLHDKDTAEILLSGGGMTVVRLPSVELEVYPELGKPLNEVAKRYLQHILPYQAITREWAKFSTSTLHASSANLKDFKKVPKSFAFTVPFVNDRSHILVRRIVDRSEKMDTYFLGDPSQSPWSGLTSCNNIDKADSIQVECASLLADMINSVAISCSENSFIKDDLDLKVEHHNEGLSELKSKLKRGRKKLTTTHKTTGSKNSRLICELRRLNATIIETNAQHTNDNQQCSNEFCELGCICPSLSNGYPMQQHCGKAKCMLQCACKGSTPSQIIRIETDGRSITTEDAYNMRRQATARLARMEKEFTSTIVVTENETLLINETEYDKKRRCTKLPKRYLDYRDTDNEFGRISPVKSCTTPQNDAIEKNLSSTIITEILSDLQQPLYIKDINLKKLKHCSIPIVPFKDIQNMAIWCMVHQMYKCFCGGNAVEGKPLQIEKEENTKILSSESGSPTKMKFSSKAYYSFESNDEAAEDIPLSTLKRRDTETNLSMNVKKIKMSIEGDYNTVDGKKSKTKFEDDDDNNKCMDVKNSKTRVGENKSMDVNKFKTKVEADLKDDDHDNKAQVSNKPESAPTSHINDFFESYFKDREHLGCCRFVPVPSLTYKKINRNRRADVMDDIEYMEDKKSQLLLNEHIMRSVYYHKEKLEEEKFERKLSESSRTSSVCFEASVPLPLKNIKLKEEKPLKEFYTETSEVPAEIKTQKPIKRNLKVFHELHPTAVKKAKISNEPSKENDLTKMVNIEKSEDSKKIKENIVNVQVESQATSNTVMLPKISGCYSLKSNPVIKQTENQNIGNNQLARAEPTVSMDSNLSSFPENVRENYNEVIKMLNNLVSRKMHDIDNALKRDSKIVPPPTENVLCVLQWRNFLGAFNDGLIYIWEVKMKTRTFLAASVTNMIPTILGALAVISITETPIERLPLIGRMLRQKVNLDENTSLAVIMQGRLHFWFVKGFLEPNNANACLRPTPQTHPELTKKINTLCSSFIKQRSRDLERRESLLKQNQKDVNKNSPQILTKETVSSNESTQSQQKHQQQKEPEEEPQQKTEEEGQNDLQQSQTFLKCNMHMDNLSTFTTNVQKTQIIAKTHSESYKIKPTIEVASTEQKLKMRPTNQSRWSSNITLQTPDLYDLNDVHLPEISPRDESWYVLDLCIDFSHIFVPVQKEIVSLDRIQRLTVLSDQKQKVIRIEFLKRSVFDAFIVPNSKRKIYFGPFPFNAEPPLLVLLQSVDGKMMTRETYQCLHKIKIKTKQTTAFWLRQKNGRLFFDNLTEKITRKTSINQINEPSDATARDSEDDCFIVENKNNNTKVNTNTEIKLPAKLTNEQSCKPQSSTAFNRSDSTIPMLSKSNKKSEQNQIDIQTHSEIKSNTAFEEAFIAKQNLILRQENEIRMQKLQNQTTKPNKKVKHEKSQLKTLLSKPPPSNIQKNVFESTKTKNKSSNNATMSNASTNLKVPYNQKPNKTSLVQNISQNMGKDINTQTAQLNSSVATSISTPVQTFTIKNFLDTTITNSVILANTTTPTIQQTKSKIPPLSPLIRKTDSTATKSTSSKMLASSTSIGNTLSKKLIVENTITQPNITTSQPTASLTPTQYQVIGSTTITPFPSNDTAEKSSPSGAFIGKKSKKCQNKETSAAAILPVSTSKNFQLNVVNEPKNQPKLADFNVRAIPTATATATASNNLKVQSSQVSLQRSSHALTTTTAATSETSSVTICFPKQRMRYTVPTDGTKAKTKNLLENTCTSQTKQMDTIPAILTPPNRDNGSSNNCKVSAVAVAKSGTTTSNPITTPPASAVYGYFCSNLPGTPRFMTKRNQFDYIIKVPGQGLVRANGIVKANAFLNQHIAKVYWRPNISWRFVQLQNNKRNSSLPGNLPIQSNPVLEKEKVITSPSVSSITIPTFKQQLKPRQLYQHLPQGDHKVSGPQVKQIIKETILIDD